MDSSDLACFLDHRRALIDYASPIVGCRALAEDIVQEAFIRCSAQQQKRDRGMQPATPGSPWHRFSPFTLPYLRQVVRNLAIDWKRSPDAKLEPVDTDTLDALPAHSVEPEQAAISSEEIALLSQALDELPARTRQAFCLYWIEGRSLKEVAQVLGVSVVRAHQLVQDAVCHGAARLDDRP